MGVTDSLWLIICVSFIFSLISTLMFVTLLKNYTINLYKKCRNTIVLTPFEKAGYTKDTKFKVLIDIMYLKKGDIVTLDEDDGSIFPLFKTEDDRWSYMFLPNMEPDGYPEELEVYEEPKKDLTPFEKAGYTKDTKFRVLRDMWYFNKGDIVTLHKDNGTDCPSFKTEDGWQDLCWLPNTVDVTECGELEVYEEPKGGI